MKLKKKIALLILLTSFASQFFNISRYSEVSADDKTKYEITKNVKTNDNGTIVFENRLQLALGDLDAKGRATSAHIQLKDSDTPKKKRAPRLKYNPVGWHNYKFYFNDGYKKAWLMNRGHLIGYQFSGLNDEARNLVPLTKWVNTGDYTGINQNNQDSMLYYEERLDSWLATHPNYYLDYKVVPIYSGDELLPRKIELHYVGIDADGQLLPIKIGGKETQDNYGISHVTLDNTSPNATIDYLTGIATNTVLSAKEQLAKKAEEEAAAAEAQRQAEAAAAAEAQRQAELAARQESRIVYVARQGTADVYWYNIDNMPSNTNWGNVVEMTEAEALAQGKRHTMKEE